jgi:hypothetical protein
MAYAMKVKDICQAVYSPIKGYKLSDLLLISGGLMSILCNADEAGLKARNINPAEAIRSIAVFERNSSWLIERINPFLEPTVINIDVLLMSARLDFHTSAVTNNTVCV